MKTGRVLIVDDDESLLKYLAGILGDSGFTVSVTSDGQEVLALVKTLAPEVILLDLWLPGMDGVEILQALRALQADVVVIVMSGYGDIATAVQVMRLGAFDYMAKPFSLQCLLSTVERALEHARLPSQPPAQGRASRSSVDSYAASLPDDAVLAQQAVCPPRSVSQRSPGPVTGLYMNRGHGHPPGPRLQRTLCRSVVLYGQGLQSGLKTGMVLSPLPPDSGILFRNIATGKTLPASIDCIESTDFCTSLRHHCVAAKTVEHLLSALHAYGITNILVKISDEIPIMDGSAAAFCHLIDDAGILEQDAIMEDFVIDRCYAIGQVQEDVKFILIEPYDGFRVTYRLVYPPPLGIQEYTYDHTDGRGYLHEIAPARTFAFVKEVEKMHELGLIAGGRLSNVVLIGEDNIVNSTQLRFPDECVRHKILDIMGDCYLLGRPLRGHIRANMTGHTENIALVKQLQTAMLQVSHGTRCTQG